MDKVDEELSKIIDRDRAWKFGRDCRTRSHEHQVSYRRWRVISLVLNVSAALFAIVAGASLIGQVAPGTTGAVIAGAAGLFSP